MKQSYSDAPGQNIRDRTFKFACGVVELCEALYERGGVARAMVSQLLGCGTSPAAMMEEARAAESRRDFISKCSIALKETREAHVRLRINEQCRIGPLDKVAHLRGEANELVAILTTILRNTRRNARLEAAAKRAERSASPDS